MMEQKNVILSAKDVEIQFSLRGKKLNAIRKCSLDLYEGETLAIVGESGSGKSVFTKSFVGMLDANGSITGGEIMFEGKDIAKYTKEKEWLTIRGKKIAMVMQDPMTSLNPLKKIGKQIQESIELHQGIKGEAAKKMAPPNFGGVFRFTLSVDGALERLGQKLQGLADVGNLLVEVQILAHHHHRLGEVQRKQADEALGIHNDAAVLGVKTHVLGALGCQVLHLLQFFNVVEMFRGNHRNAPFIRFGKLLPIKNY